MAQGGGKKKRTEEFQRERMVRRYDLAKWTLPPLIWIVSLWVPLQGALPIAKALAGQKTTLTVSFSLTIVVSLAASSALLAVYLRSREDKKELQRLRGLVEAFEAQEGGGHSS